MRISPRRTVKQVRFYVAFSVHIGFRIIDQDDRFSTWIDRLSAQEAISLCQLLNDEGPAMAQNSGFQR